MMGIQWDIVWRLLLGEMPMEKFIAYCLAMGAGALIFFALDVSHSVNKDAHTPKKFSWKFLIKDNIIRGLGVLLAIMATVILYEDFFGVAINVKLALTSGLGIDAIIGVLLKKGKERGPMKKSRDKLIERYG